MRPPVVLAALAIVGGTALAGGDGPLLPPSGFLGTWNVEGKPRLFPGSELYGHIDGGAEIFFEFGFEEATVQRYRSPAGEVVVEHYTMSDPLGALGIYLGKCGKETPDPTLAERHTAGRFQLMFVRDRYFVIVDNLAGTPALTPVLVEFARFIASRLPESRPVTVFDTLPKQGQIEGSRRLIRGPVALEAIATLGRGDILQLGGRTAAVAADYSDAAGKYTVIIATYPDVQAAAAAFRNLTDNLDSEIKPLARTETRLVFRDYDGTFGTASLGASRLELRLRLRQEPPLK
ncbi:MAG: hypothetical protein A2Y78_04690 [Acidobacteria bacterium RBG_13_68_16]|nr:MAG: hypothetical protein A2Y78_04690 [Acidobacteria bacterium RBG_13_68_16]